MSRAGAVIGFLVLGLAAAPAAGFETNGRHWDTMPVTYWINPAECPALADGSTIVEILERATQAWEDVPCADVQFQLLGTTDKTWDNDGQNTIYCVSDPAAWQFGVGAAGATLWLPKPEGETPEVDLALNAADLEWRDGGGDALETGVMDPQAMITHELGHWLGLAHTPDPYGTMYYGLLPNGIQKTLAGDDRAGLCTLYPSGVTECATDEDCGEDRRCTVIQGVPVCDEVHDGPGAPCDKAYIDCEGMCWVSLYECSQLCWFTDPMATEGYCAP
ncbi:MAG: matrixin family metalloprotease, partial [Deltaproteobacteria bacterium]|nr:matrixin family metalloprotease [Deltaproteobacteria bacterium]